MNLIHATITTTARKDVHFDSKIFSPHLVKMAPTKVRTAADERDEPRPFSAV